MRRAFAASAVCLCLFMLAIQPATSDTSAPATAATPTAVAAASEAAAKHAKRTACLKETKTRKLVGADKTMFLKNCIEAPAEPISASRQIPPSRP
jgi:hypothetical protein